ncbi:MAG: protein kinase [Clostridia bacterium]|nr:protein kinase [Clostridia bacterium]
MSEINGYVLNGELKTTNSGFSKWGFAQRNGRSYFIKEFIDPIWPVCQDMLTPTMVEHKKRICEQYENRSRLLYKMINDCSDGNLVQIEDFFRCGSHYYLVMEKIEAVGIEEVRCMTAEDQLRVCKALVHCLGQLHKSGIVHADIKLDNILFRRLPSGKVTGKLIDFDNCFWERQPPQPDEEIHCDLVYMAPETFMMMQTEEGTLTRAIDVFALGIVFHQILTGKAPAFDSSKFDYPFEAVLGGERLEVSAEIPNEWRQLIERMLQGDPQKRVTLSEAEVLLRGENAKAAEYRQEPFFMPAGDL